MENDPKRAAIIAALYAFAAQRPGIEPGNYHSWSSYRSESREVTRDLHDARTLIRAVEQSSMDAETLLGGFRAFSGRLSCKVWRQGEEPPKPEYYGHGHIEAVVTEGGAHYAELSYCAGQYFPTEYRKAVAAVCASALWDYHREDFTAAADRKGTSPGDEIRRGFLRMFGRPIAWRWFDARGVRA